MIHGRQAALALRNALCYSTPFGTMADIRPTGDGMCLEFSPPWNGTTKGWA